MKLKVPFYNQTTPLNCGPTALRMVLSYFGDKTNIEELEKRTGIKQGKALSSIQIAIAAASLKYRTDFFSKHILFNEENLKLDYYKKYSDIDLEYSKELIKEAEKQGVKITEKTLSLEELLSCVTKNSVPIILLDWNIITGKNEKGYQGHFVPLVGYSKENIYVHNHGFNNPQEFLPINKEIFDKARKADGTDEDIIIIHRH